MTENDDSGTGMKEMLNEHTKLSASGNTSGQHDETVIREKLESSADRASKRQKTAAAAAHAVDSDTHIVGLSD